MDDQDPKKPRLPRLRPSGREPRFSKLRSMKCFSELHQRILDGYQLSELSRWIQEDMREYLDVTRPSLLSVLKEYRSSLPPAELISQRIPTTFHKAEQEIKKGLDELEEMEQLYKLQMERVNIDFEKEKQIKKLLTTTGQEVRIAKEILSEFADLKMDLGLTDRHIGKVEIDAKLKADVMAQYGKESVGQVMTDPESRQRVMGVAQALLKLSAAKQGLNPVIDAEVVQDVPPGTPPKDPSGEAE